MKFKHPKCTIITGRRDAVPYKVYMSVKLYGRIIIILNS